MEKLTELLKDELNSTSNSLPVLCRQFIKQKAGTEQWIKDALLDVIRGNLTSKNVLYGVVVEVLNTRSMHRHHVANAKRVPYKKK